MPIVSPAGMCRERSRITGEVVLSARDDPRFVSNAVVFKADIFELNIPGHGADGQRFLTGGDDVIGIQQIEDAFGGGHRALVHIEGVAQTGQGPEQPLGDENEHGINPHVEVPSRTSLPPKIMMAANPPTINMRIKGTKAELSLMASSLAIRYKSL